MIRTATEADLDALAGLRHALWPDERLETRRAETCENLAHAGDAFETFVAVDGANVIGFAEVSLRRDHVNGCTTSPVAFLEGIYVRPDGRRRGVGRALVAAAEKWGRDRGCREFASDAFLADDASHRFHGAVGFEETERVVYFRKSVADPSAPATPGYPPPR